MPTPYIPIDADLVVIDSNITSIEGYEVSKTAGKNRPIHTNDYLGIGTPLYKR